MSGYTQLTQEERYQIHILKRAGHNQSEIAETLGRHKTTISRELERNTGLSGYRPKQAHRWALQRRNAWRGGRFKSPHWAQIAALLRQDLSPEQAANRLAAEQGIRFCHEWVYQFIYADKRDGGDLYQYLRCRKKRRKRYGKYGRRGCIPNQISIENRPAIVDSRRRFGDWEGDTMIGKGHRGAIVSVVERKSRYTFLAQTNHKSADAVRRCITKNLAPHKKRVHTLTLDNGREFSDHQDIAADLDVRIYFAHPYASWERGTSENTNGLVRQYLPKQRDLRTVTKEELEHIMNKLNHRPRKCLGYRTPHEVFFNTKTRLTVALKS